MRAALDATYSADANPSGVGVYSREILDGLAAMFPNDQFIHCYRWKQWRRRPSTTNENITARLLLPPLPTFRAEVFHALNQRVDRRPAPHVVATFHDLFVMTAEYSSAEFRRRFTRQARAAAANSDVVIAVSQFTALQVEELLDIPASRIRVIPHGVHQPAGGRITGGRPFVLFAGALQIRKNLLALVKAFEALPEEWRLVLAGSASGYGADSILEAIQKSRSAARIEVTGYVPRTRLEDLYRSASIFAFASLDEGFGIPVLEAMAYGVPVITSSGSALREVAGAAALLVDPRNPDELEEALQRLVGDGELRADLAQRGKERSLQFTWESAVRRTHAVYCELS